MQTIHPHLGGLVPPHDKEVEEAVLAAMLLSADALITASQMVRPEHFYHEENLLVCRAIQSLSSDGKPIDIIAVAAKLKEAGELTRIGGPKQLAKISSRVASAAHIEVHARLLIEHYLKRQVIGLGQTIAAKGFADETDIFETIAATQISLDTLLSDTISSEDISFQSALDAEYNRWLGPKTGLAGQSTFIPEVDNATGGLVNGELVVIAARPGQGKTAFALSIMRNYLLHDLPVAFFSLEMPYGHIMTRLVSQQSGVWTSKIRANTYNQYDFNAMTKARAEMYPWKMFVCDKGGIRLSELRARAMKMKRKNGIKLLVVDYLQLMGGDKSKKSASVREQEISEISRGLKSLAKELDIPIIALAQLSRGVESRPDKMPILSDLRESGAIEQDADQVIFLMRPAYYKMEGNFEINGKEYDPETLCVMDVAKYRAGATGTTAIKYEAPLMRFTSFERPDLVKEFGPGLQELPESTPSALSNPLRDRISEFEKDNPF